MQLPKITVKKHTDGVYSYGVFRSDRIKAIIKNISRPHANHIKKILLRMEDIPESITPIDNWQEYDYIVPDEEINEKTN